MGRCAAARLCAREPAVMFSIWEDNLMQKKTSEPVEECATPAFRVRLPRFLLKHELEHARPTPGSPQETSHVQLATA